MFDYEMHQSQGISHIPCIGNTHTCTCTNMYTVHMCTVYSIIGKLGVFVEITNTLVLHIHYVTVLNTSLILSHKILNTKTKLKFHRH